MAQEVQDKPTGLTAEDLQGLDFGGDDGEKATKMVQLLEKNFSRQFSQFAASLSKIKTLEDEIELLKNNTTPVAQEKGQMDLGITEKNI